MQSHGTASTADELDRRSSAGVSCIARTRFCSNAGAPAMRQPIVVGGCGQKEEHCMGAGARPAAIQRVA